MENFGRPTSGENRRQSAKPRGYLTDYTCRRIYVSWLQRSARSCGWARVEGTCANFRANFRAKSAAISAELSTLRRRVKPILRQSPCVGLVGLRRRDHCAPSRRHVADGVHGSFCRRDLRAACVPEEIQEWHRHAEEGHGTDPATFGGSRATASRKAELTSWEAKRARSRRKSPPNKVAGMFLPIWVFLILSRSS